MRSPTHPTPTHPSPTHPSARRRAGRLLVGASALSLVAAPGLLVPPAAVADPAVAATAGRFTIHGAGYGHGHGMSQYGAYGAARKGLGWTKILRFYYPGTTLTKVPAGSSIKVWISADSDADLRVAPVTGLAVRDRSGHRLTLPTGKRYTQWRVSRSGAGYRLAYLTRSGSWRARSTALDTSTWSFAAPSKTLSLVLPGGRRASYRGSMALVKRDSGGRTVNTLSLENYVRSVVPAEMPTSWSADAVRAQAVAARSYALYLRGSAGGSGYDLCDTTTCQVYGGRAYESPGGDAAAEATRRTVVSYRGTVALTQFSSSNGGALAASNLPYLVAKPDPYDAVVTSQAWTRTLTAAGIAQVWPSVGTVRKLRVSARDGSGAWGGRVQTITIVGDQGSVSVSGEAFQYRFGMRSSLFTLVAG